MVEAIPNSTGDATLAEPNSTWDATRFHRGDGPEIVTPAMRRNLELQHRIEVGLKKAQQTMADQEREIDRRLGR
ncbi:hypothetical protein IPM62_01140 [Candidatus Woesebacteria bacterium]|nr:MAG: hypothetical protein IPM62_01140 [Candidatus Woesebacteria bacterium]